MLVVSTGDREEALKAFLSSARWRYPGVPVVGVLQGYEAAPAGLTDAVLLPQPVGAHAARLTGLLKWEFPVWVTCDDDMVFVDKTDLESPIEVASSRPDVGLISTLWRRSQSQIDSIKLADTYLRQHIVFTGGGAVATNDTMDVIRTLPLDAHYVSDNVEWALATYLFGKQNLRFRGSVSLHAAMSKGGRRAYLHRTAAQRPDPALINTESCKPFYEHESNNMLMPNDSHLTPLAKEIHQMNRAQHYPHASVKFP